MRVVFFRSIVGSLFLALVLAAAGPLAADELTLEGTDTAVVDVPADETRMQRVYVTAPAGSPAATEERTDIELIVEDRTNDERVNRSTVFHGKGN